MTHKTSLDQEPQPSHPLQPNSGVESTHEPPPAPSRIDIGEVHRRVVPTTSPHPREE